MSNSNACLDRPNVLLLRLICINILVVAESSCLSCGGILVQPGFLFLRRHPTAIEIQHSKTQHHVPAVFHNLPPRATHLVSEVLLVCSDDNILLFFCQCQRQVVIRAAHPENLPRLYPLSRANERSTAEDYLRKKSLYVPQPFPDGFMVFCLSTCSGDSHPAASASDRR